MVKFYSDKITRGDKMDDVVVEVIKKIIQIDKDVAEATDAFDRELKNKKVETQKQVEDLRKNIIEKQAESIEKLKEDKINEANCEAEKIMSEAHEKCSRMIKQFEDKKDQIVNEIFSAIVLNSSK